MRCLRFVVITMLVMGLFGSWAACAVTEPDVNIFKGDDPTQEGIALGGWGSGSAAKTNERVLDGAWSIKMTTQGLYSGAKIEFHSAGNSFRWRHQAGSLSAVCFLFQGHQSRESGSWV